MGDAVYGFAKGRARFPVPFPRQALHAQALGFVHPITGQALRIEAPLPTDLKDLIAGLRERFGLVPPVMLVSGYHGWRSVPGW